MSIQRRLNELEEHKDEANGPNTVWSLSKAIDTLKEAKLVTDVVDEWPNQFSEGQQREPPVARLD